MNRCFQTTGKSLSVSQALSHHAELFSSHDQHRFDRRIAFPLAIQPVALAAPVADCS
jgi:hypothetical protein